MHSVLLILPKSHVKHNSLNSYFLPLMGDPKNPNPPSFSLLPPGCRFFPSDEQLLCYYLTLKNKGDHSSGFDVIKEIEFYNFEPFDLPDSVCFRFGRGGRKRHYYCYVPRVLREEGRRRAGSGYWKRSGRVRDVLGGGAGKVVGTRRSFVFYLGDSPKNAVRTDWIMYEYALPNHHVASFVLCRAFIKSCISNRSEHPLSSVAEESAATVRHIGVQHDGTVRQVLGEANMQDDNFPEHENEVLRFPMGMVGDVDDNVTSGPVGLQDDNFPEHENEVLRFPMGMVGDLDDNVTSGPVGLQMISSGLSIGRDSIVDSLTAEQSVAILEEDFLELDDLVSPLPGID